MNAELSKANEQTLRHASDGDVDDSLETIDDVFSLSNGAATARRTCTIVLSARDAGTLSRIFKVFEVQLLANQLTTRAGRSLGASPEVKTFRLHSSHGGHIPISIHLPLFESKGEVYGNGYAPSVRGMKSESGIFVIFSRS